MSDLPIARRALVALLVLSTALFALGVISERSRSDEHPPRAEAVAHEESGGESGEAAEQVLGVDAESTPLIVVAVLAGLALAAIAATPLGQRPAVLVAIALIALAWAALDIREAAHQLDESHPGIAAFAFVVAALHLAVAAIAGRLAARGRAATMPA